MKKQTEIGRGGVQATHMKRVKAAGGKSYKFTSPGRRNVPDTIDLLGFEEARNTVLDLVRAARLQRDTTFTVEMADLCTKRIVERAIRFTECKAPGKKPRPGQQREIARLRKMGYRVDVVDR